MQGKKPGRKRKARYRGGNRGWQRGMRNQAAGFQNGNKNKKQSNKNVKGKSNYGKQNAPVASAARKQPGMLGLPQSRSFLASSVGHYMGWTVWELFTSSMPGNLHVRNLKIIPGTIILSWNHLLHNTLQYSAFNCMWNCIIFISLLCRILCTKVVHASLGTELFER